MSTPTGAGSLDGLTQPCACMSQAFSEASARVQTSNSLEAGSNATCAKGAAP
jgi:hypothetical protein